MFPIWTKSDEKWESYCHYLHLNVFSVLFPPPIRNVQISQFSYIPSYSLYRQFHSFADANMHLFRSLELKSIDDINWYWFRHPIQNCSLLLFVRTNSGQLIRYEMSKFARLRNLMIPAFIITSHHNSCTKVFFVWSVYNWHIIYWINCSCFHKFHAITIPF